MRNLRRTWVAAGAAVALAWAATGVLADTAAAATPPAGRAATGTAAAPINEPSIGALAPTTPIHVAVALKLPNQAGLDRAIAAEYTPGSAGYRQFLTPAQFSAQYAPSPAAVAQVSSWLRSQGLTDVAPSANRLLVSASGTASQVEAAFATPLARFPSSAGTVYANTAAATVPASLGGIVSSVLGLDDIRVTLTHVQTAAAASPTLTPPQFAQAYNGTSLAPASGQSIGIITDGNVSPVITDLRTEESANGLPQVPVSVVQAGAAGTDTTGVDEFDLDTQTSTGIAGTTADVTLFNATSLADSDIAAAVNAFATQSSVKEASASLGECEVLANASGFESTVDASLQEAVAQGLSFFASSGDNGAACPLPVISQNGVPLLGIPGTVEYPASSTWTTGVGGTTLNRDASGNYASETAWTAGGGGFALTSAPGPWVGNAPNNGLGAVIFTLAKTLGGGRPVPDVAMDADPSTGAVIYYEGKTEAVGGTSLSSPLALGGWARVQQADGGNLGDAAPAFYKLYNGNPPGQTPGFHDITSGTNGLYLAGTGFDPVTGIGTLNLAPLAAAL